MPTHLRIADNLTLPPEAVTQTFAVLAKRGSGKTYTALVLVEEMLKASLQVVVADPVGVAWGLRSSADGKRPGLPIVVLGGDHGDLPLLATSGEIVANLVVDERVSAVLDLSHLRKAEMRRFMTAFAETVYHRNRAPLHLVLDEADEFAPQNTGRGGDVLPLLGAIEDLVRRGRARGIGVTLITQRPAVLNKDVLTQVEVLVALRLIAPQDRAALDEWVKVHGTPEQRDELMRSLPSLPIGAAWFWSPGWLNLFKRVQVRRRETFDSSATPKVGEQRPIPKTLANVDLAALKDRMAATIERARADDPRELRRRIAELERQLKERPAADARVEVRIETVEIPVFKNGELPRAERVVSEIGSLIPQLAKIAAELGGRVDAVKGWPSAAPSAPTVPVVQSPRPKTGHLMTAERPKAVARPTAEYSKNNSTPTEGISAPQQRILDALASFEALGIDAAARANVAVFADQSSTSSGYTNNLGALRSKGLIDYPSGGLVALTGAGRAVASPSETIRTLGDLHAAWQRKLPDPRWRILSALIDAYPETLSRDELAKRAKQSPASSGYTNNLGGLRSLGVLDYPSRGQVMATGLLFPEGLRYG